METATNKNDNPTHSTVLKGSELPPLVTDGPPRALIAGAGLAGLFLGILLEKAGIPYEIFERASEIRPIGSIMCLAPNILAAFEQLGLYEELMSFSKPALEMNIVTSDLKVISNMEAASKTKMYQIPPHKVHLSKKVLSFLQNQEGVMIRFSDNTTAHGDILVGADGVNSAVRQHLYKTLDEEGLLPKNDIKAMTKGYICVLGTTEPLDPAKYPGLLKEYSEGYYIIGDKNSPYTVRIDALADDQFRSSDWVPQQNQKFLDSIRHFKTPYGTMGDLFDVTPIERVCKVYFEDMLFETWNHGRTVLIGDAAHKLLPSSGAGAVNAMQDAVLLANHLYDIRPTSFENIKTALKEYKEERFDSIKEQYPQSYMGAKVLYGHSLFERFLRQIVFNYVPESLKEKQLYKDTAYRPQANFLPQAPKRGTIDIIPQKPSKHSEKKIQEQGKGTSAAAL
ncbi:hypothetical protein FBU30_003613 [Linnemannia zychae]|nr:hypothetical protein FBU30_003613 [Linnemannia zychae]